MLGHEFPGGRFSLVAAVELFVLGFIPFSGGVLNGAVF